MYRKIILRPLVEDVEENKKLILQKDSQFHRRNYVRALFSLFEASLSNLREQVGTMLYDQVESGKKSEFNLHEFLPILDQDVQLKSNGEMNLVPNKYPFVGLVAYIFKKYAEVNDLDIDLLSNHKWRSFQKAIKIRNRIVHPVNKQDAEISDDDLILIYEAEDWWKESVTKLNS